MIIWCLRLFQHYFKSWKGTNERLCAVKRHLVMGWTPSLAVFEPWIVWSEDIIIIISSSSSSQKRKPHDRPDILVVC